jgi:Kef-type K+ transport system membrane component KefB
MDKMTPHDITMLFLALGVLLILARGLGDLAKRLRQPEVLGEILAGVLLGPTVMGSLAPGVIGSLFPSHGATTVALNGVTTVGIALFLFVAGIEVDLSALRRNSRVAFAVSVSGMAIPFALGLGAAAFAPDFFGWGHQVDQLTFALFLATALSISALPVIARTLMDLHLYRTDLGVVVISAAFVNDLVGWIVFSAILGTVATSGHSVSGPGGTVWMTVGFAAAMLTGGRWALHRALPWVEAHTKPPEGVLGLALSLALLSAAFTEWIGVHAILGAFLAGVAFGDSSHLHERTRIIIRQFVSSFFAPLFFATIGLHVNFIASFDWALVSAIFVLASIGKVLGCGLSAQASGWAPREAWAIGFAMNARGAMEIILGLLAFEYSVISERMFVALVVVAIATSMLSGPVMQCLLKPVRPRRLVDSPGAKALPNPDRRS